MLQPNKVDMENVLTRTCPGYVVHSGFIKVILQLVAADNEVNESAEAETL